MNHSKRFKVCLICSVGGHFKQLLKISPAWEDFDYYYVLMDKPIINSFILKEKVYIITNPERNPFLFVKNMIESLIIFLKTMPDVVISTGAGMAIAFCYIAKLFGKKIVFIEEWCLLSRPSITGRLIYPISDLFIIQRDHFKKFYPKSVFGGELF